MPWEVWLFKAVLLKALRWHYWRFIHHNTFICGYWYTPTGEGRLMSNSCYTSESPSSESELENRLIEEHTSNLVIWRFACMVSILKSADPQSLEGGNPNPVFLRSTIHTLQSSTPPTQTLAPSLSKSRKTLTNRAPKRRNLPLSRRSDPSKS